MGHDVRKEPMAVKARIGVVPQEVALYQDLSGLENLEFWGKMYALRGAELKRRVAHVLDIVGLTDRQKSRVDTYSGGMKRRLNIAAALMHRPEVIIMDEPTVGIDPQSRRYILDNVKALNDEGMTVLYTTHYMEEAQELSDRIGIMDRGELIALGSHAELVKLVGEQDRIDLTLNSGVERLLETWPSIEGVYRVSRGPTVEDAPMDGHVTLLVEDSNLILPRLFESATGVGARITSVEIQEPNLEAVFLHLTGRTLRD
jgi:ABC-2 type transport system ATP-binding protein